MLKLAVRLSSFALLLSSMNCLTGDVQHITSNLGGALPNITVSLHSPVVVPAMSDGLPDDSRNDLTLEPPGKQTPPGRPLVAIDSHFALINGTPIFFHPAEAVVDKSNGTTIDAVNKAVGSVAEEIRNDTMNVAKAVIKAVEHFSNISSGSISTSPTAHEESSIKTDSGPGNGSSVSVVVVPLIQNAFDLVESNRSPAHIAASNPFVITSKEGNHTTLHVVVKRQVRSSHASNNSHGPLNEIEVNDMNSEQHLSASNETSLSDHRALPGALDEISHVSGSNGTNLAPLALAPLPIGSFQFRPSDGKEQIKSPDAPPGLVSVLIPAPQPAILLSPELISIGSIPVPETLDEIKTRDHGDFTQPLRVPDTLPEPALRELSSNDTQNRLAGTSRPLPIGRFQFLPADQNILDMNFSTPPPRPTIFMVPEWMTMKPVPNLTSKDVGAANSSILHNITVNLSKVPSMQPVQESSVAGPDVFKKLPVGTFQFLPSDLQEHNVSQTDLLRLH